jgi:hypothetical protein
MGRELQQAERLMGKQRALLYIVVCTSTWMSMRSSSGPLMCFWERAMLSAERVHAQEASPANPQRHPCE